MKFKIPGYAKEDARKALVERQRLPKSKQFGIDKTEANRLRINSGVERAKQIIRSKYLREEDAKRVAAFYNRFKNCNTSKCEGSIDLWGGRKFGRQISSKIKSSNK